MKKAFIFIFVFVLAFASCSNGSTGGNGTHTVRYEISGPQVIAYRVMYSNETGNHDQITDVPIPWEKTITVQGPAAVGCSAIIISNNSTYTAKIFVDSKEVGTASSSSGSVSVSASIR